MSRENTAPLQLTKENVTVQFFKKASQIFVKEAHGLL
jgi:hypothetical protein